MKRFCAVLWVSIMILSLIGCSGSSNTHGQSDPILSYPIDTDVQTTVQRTIVLSTTFSGTIPPQNLCNIPQYDQYGYGVWSYGPPLNPELRTDIAPGYTAGATKAKKLLNFFTMTDVHITDKEAPNQLIYLQQSFPPFYGNTSAYSGVMLYTTQVLDAAIQTVNALHKSQPFDFGICLGDAANSTQYKEIRWFLDVIDGKVITPSSGAHLGADTIDFQKPFKAAGLDKSIPWYQALGNHDHNFIGSFPVDAFNLRDTYTTGNVFAIGEGAELLTNPMQALHQSVNYMGVLDGLSPYGAIKYAGPVGNFSTPPTVASDPDRRSLTKQEWVNEFFNTTSYPIGHGFQASNVENDFACYSFMPKSNVPIKVIVLDDTQKDDDGANDIHGHGFLTQDRWNWLKQELTDGDTAGQLMIIACHIPIAVESQGSELEWWNNPQNATDISGLITELEKHPNLLMWIAGHRHLNTIKAFASNDTDHPENGFWQVETSSLRDFPQQFRTFQIYVNSDYTISIIATGVDTAIRSGTPAATSRKYAAAAQQICQTNLSPNVPNSDPFLPANQPDPSIHPIQQTIGSYNAEMIKQLSPEMQQKIKEYVLQNR
jgi:metallophosphoesterase (TIGR03768 family)